MSVTRVYRVVACLTLLLLASCIPRHSGRARHAQAVTAHFTDVLLSIEPGVVGPNQQIYEAVRLRSRMVYLAVYERPTKEQRARFGTYWLRGVPRGGLVEVFCEETADGGCTLEGNPAYFVRPIPYWHHPDSR